MSTTVSYTKTLRNASFLVTLIQESIQTLVLNYYNYDTTTSGLSLTFKTVPDTASKQIIDTLVINYNENHALGMSKDDFMSFKFAQFSSAMDQPLSTTPTDVLFQSELYVDRQYYMASSRSYIYIQKPGTYLVIARMTSHTYAPFVDNSCVQYDLFYDDTRTEQGFLVYPNNAVYTTHRNVSNGQETAIMACVFTCNPSMGSYIKIQAKMIAGNSPMAIKGDFTSIKILNIPNASYFESTLGQQISAPTSYTNLFISRDRIVNYPFSHTAGQASVVIQNAGWLFLIARATFLKTSGTDNTEASLRFYSLGQFAFMAGTSGYSTEVVTGMKTTANFTGLIPVNAGTTITYQAMITQGTNMFITAGETGFVAVFLNASLYPQISLLNSFTDVTQVNGPYLSANVYQDLTFTTLRTLQPAAPSNTVIFSTTTPEIIINDTGVFTISAHISVHNPSNNAGQLTVRLANSVDGGITYYYIIGSRASRSIGRQDKTSVTTMSILPVSNGHRVKVQCNVTNAAGDNIVFADSCTLSLMKFSTTSKKNTNDSITSFGKIFQFVVSKETMQTTSTTYVEKSRLITSFIPAGIYKISSRASLLVPIGETITYELITSSPTGQLTEVSQKDITLTEQAFETVDFIYLNDGVHTFIQQIKTVNGTLVSISSANIELCHT